MILEDFDPIPRAAVSGSGFAEQEREYSMIEVLPDMPEGVTGIRAGYLHSRRARCSQQTSFTADRELWRATGRAEVGAVFPHGAADIDAARPQP